MDEDFDFDLSELPIDEQLDMINDVVADNLKYLFGDRYKEHVVVKQSTVTDENGNSVGFGLFATKNIKENAIIGVYEGERIARNITSQPTYESDYLAALSDDMSIDAAHPFSCFTRYINDGLSEEINNSNWTVTRGLLKVKAIRDIKKGEEIFLSYGTYWAEKDKFERLTSQGKLLLYNDDTRDDDLKLWIDENYKYIDGNWYYKPFNNEGKKRPLKKV